jgi:branched-chain amino acid aminotransferase
MKEAAVRGFDNAVVLDLNGNVAEFDTSNLCTVTDSVAHTSIPNGTLLNGITRQRVINLQHGRDVKVVKRSVTLADLVAAAEIFSTGNHSKVVPVIRYEEHDLQPGPVSQLVQGLYWEYAHQGD